MLLQKCRNATADGIVTHDFCGFGHKSETAKEVITLLAVSLELTIYRPFLIGALGDRLHLLLTFVFQIYLKTFSSTVVSNVYVEYLQ